MYSHVNKVLKFGGGGRWGVQSPLIRVPRDEQLRSLWGSVQLGWYGTDVDGHIVPHAADLPLLRDESESESDEQ